VTIRLCLAVADYEELQHKYENNQQQVRESVTHVCLSVSLSLCTLLVCWLTLVVVSF